MSTQYPAEANQENAQPFIPPSGSADVEETASRPPGGVPGAGREGLNIKIKT